MKIINFSKFQLLSTEKNNDPINIITQFYIDSNKERQQEIMACLKANYSNPFITHIYLLNERIYSPSELGIFDSFGKIIQINLKKRLTYQDVFSFIKNHDIKGYNVFMNSDIFLDHSIEKLCYTDIHLNKKMFALVRYEYDPSNIDNSKLFVRFDSQDTWIIHSNFNIPNHIQKIFNFSFGKPGCDNKLIYLMNILNYEIINEPGLIKTYHYHTSQVRNYGRNDVIKEPWGFVVPSTIHYTKMPQSLGIDLQYIATKTKNFSEIKFSDNTLLYNYVLEKLNNNIPFVIPRISGVENNVALIGNLIEKKISTPPQIEYLNQLIPKMKNNAGIKLTNIDSVITYSQCYLKAFEHADTYFTWEPYGMYYPTIIQSLHFVHNKYDKPKLWSSALDIYHYIFGCPWTLALKGKKVLIISPFETTLKKQFQHHALIYGIDLFPECILSVISPPQTQGLQPSEDFSVELAKFTKTLDTLDYDIALVSCGGYGNLVCNHIFSQGKSAIYVGGVLQMYFGILGNRWLIDRPDILRLFLNEYWSKPSNSEKPKGFNNIEGGCYW